jgi:hypothetical protein
MMVPFEIGSGDRGSIDWLSVAKRVVFDCVDAIVQTMHHFAQTVPESSIFVDKNLFVLVLE